MKTIGIFFPLMLADLVYAFLNPPPGRSVNPFFLYLLVFAFGFGLISIGLGRVAPRFGTWGPAAAVFLAVSVPIAVFEELVAYATRSGFFQDPRHTLAAGLVSAAVPLIAWTAGVLVVALRYPYTSSQLFFLVGFSGWLSEVTIGGLLRTAPLLALAIIPAVIVSYINLIYLPYRTIEPRLPARTASWWRFPAAVIVPSMFWLAGGIVGAVATRLTGLVHA